MATHTSLASLFNDIADAIREKTGDTDSIVADNFPSEIAAIGGAKIGVTLNDDGTQNLYITDNGSVLDLATGTADATATAADVMSGKTFYAEGVKKTGTLTASAFDPVLLWTNASPTSNFNAQTLSLSGQQYSAYVIEIQSTTNNSNMLVKTYLPFGFTGRVYASTVAAFFNRDITSVSSTGITFGYGYQGNASGNDYGIPTRIWGVKFTL